MRKSDFKLGEIVLFGRPNGEKTKGKIVKLNPKRAKVESLESRGSKSVAGGTWVVPYSLLTKLDADRDLIESNLEAFGGAKPVEKVTYSPFGGEDNHILAAISGCYAMLEPERLFADGERSRSEAARIASRCRAKLKHLFAALGREVSEDEAFDWTISKREFEANRAG